jgi:hypothetical protein
MADKQTPAWPWSAFRAPNYLKKADAHADEAHVESAAPGTQSRTVGKPSAIPNQLGYAPIGDPTVLLAKRAADREIAFSGVTNERFPQLATHGRAHPITPEYNVWYDQYATREAYDKIILNTAHGTLTGPTSQVVVLDAPARLRLSEWPGGTQAFPVLLLFTYSQAAAATSGQYTFSFTPDGGDFIFPLGEFNATQLNTFQTQRWIIPAQVTDPGVTRLGIFTVTNTAVVAPAAINWRFGIGWAYILRAPAFKAPLPTPPGAATFQGPGSGPGSAGIGSTGKVGSPSIVSSSN